MNSCEAQFIYRYFDFENIDEYQSFSSLLEEKFPGTVRATPAGITVVGFSNWEDVVRLKILEESFRND